ncbi:MAG: DUF2147 domain-containing protein [Alphaproteobacteria bacterium]|nr:DUF2147 domain-containing protein [Alphaproteobacteria bacterium]
MRLALYTGIFLATSVAWVNPAAASDPTGDWLVKGGFAHVRVAECNGAMWGVVAWEQQAGLDEHNPDVAKQSRPTLGMPVLLNMKKTPGHDQWEGEVYNAEDGKTYSSTITPHGTDQLEIKGCVLGILCGGETWTRVGPPIPPSLPKTAPKAGSKGAAPRTAGAPVAPRSAGSKAARPADPEHPDVGDICLLPDIAGVAH